MNGIMGKLWLMAAMSGHPMDLGLGKQRTRRLSGVELQQFERELPTMYIPRVEGYLRLLEITKEDALKDNMPKRVEQCEDLIKRAKDRIAEFRKEHP